MTSKMFLRRVIATTATLILGTALASAQDVLRIASADRGAWELAAPELGQRAGIFKKHGIMLDLHYTDSNDEALERMLSDKADIAVGLSTVQVLRAYLRGAPLRIIGANVTGAQNFWYVLATSPLQTFKDLAGKTIAYATNGSSSHYDALDFNKEYGLRAKLVPTGDTKATFNELSAQRIDVAWAAPPFGLPEMLQGKIRIIARANDVAKIRGKTISVMTVTATMSESRKDVLARFMKAYRESIDWIYSDRAALKQYAEFAGVSEELAQRLRDEFYTKTTLAPDKVSGLRLIMKDANLKLTSRKVTELVQIPGSSSWRSFFSRH